MRAGLWAALVVMLEVGSTMTDAAWQTAQLAAIAAVRDGLDRIRPTDAEVEDGAIAFGLFLALVAGLIGGWWA